MGRTLCLTSYQFAGMRQQGKHRARMDMHQGSEGTIASQPLYGMALYPEGKRGIPTSSFGLFLFLVFA
jgi:hypothetical protein